MSIESNPSTSEEGTGIAPSSGRAWGALRLLIGVGVLAALYYFGKFDLRALAPLAHAPWTAAAAAAFILVTLPLSALRWLIVLDVLDIALPIGAVFRIVCISTAVSQFLLGSTSGDAIRGVYAWHLLRRGSGRIVVSIIADRAVGLFAFIILAALLVTLRWERVREVPELMLLTVSLMACVAVVLVSGVALLGAPSLLILNLSKLQSFPRVTRLLIQVHGVATAFRSRPLALSIVFFLSLVIQGLIIATFIVIANMMHIGNASLLDVSIAAPLAIVANVLPFTPGGLGVGEAAFDQLCRWLAPVSHIAPYASLFFAFRALSMTLVIPGLISYVGYWGNTTPSRWQDSASRKKYVPQDPN